MAELRAEGTDIVVHLNAWEAAVAWRRQLRLPVSCVRMVHVDEAPVLGLTPLRLPGLAWPHAFAVGSCGRRGQRQFAAVHAGKPAVVLETEGAPWLKVVVSHPDAVEIAADLAAMLLRRGPAKLGTRGRSGTSPSPLD